MTKHCRTTTRSSVHNLLSWLQNLNLCSSSSYALHVWVCMCWIHIYVLSYCRSVICSTSYQQSILSLSVSEVGSILCDSHVIWCQALDGCFHADSRARQSCFSLHIYCKVIDFIFLSSVSTKICFSLRSMSNIRCIKKAVEEYYVSGVSRVKDSSLLASCYADYIYKVL